MILLIALLCSLGSGAARHNLSAVELCFYDMAIPTDVPDEYRVCIEAMRSGFILLDSAIVEINEQTEDGSGLDDIRVKAIFYALYFGADSPSLKDCRKFADCFVTYEERTRTVTTENEGGTTTEAEETYTVAVPIEDLAQVYQNISSIMGMEATPEQQGNADSVYSLIRYGYTGGSGFAGADVPYIGADGFCSPHRRKLAERGHLGVRPPQRSFHWQTKRAQRHGSGGAHRHAYPGSSAGDGDSIHL